MAGVGGTPRRKPGSRKLSGRTARRNEQRAFRKVCQEFGISRKEDQRTFHEAITGLGLDYNGMREKAKELFGSPPMDQP